MPIQRGVHYSDTERNFIRVWLRFAISIGLLLPSLAWIVWIRKPRPRRILGLYLFVLAIQIVTERVAVSIGVPSLVVTIGTLYTAFRIWQLWQGQQLIHQGTWNSVSRKSMSAFLNQEDDSATPSRPSFDGSAAMLQIL